MSQAAAALSIGCGSFSEPDEVEGLAHFVEHMVFMGNKKYPEENSFDVFVKVDIRRPMGVGLLE